MKIVPFSLLCAAATGLCQAQLPRFYQKIDRVVWVVRDANAVADGWTRLGLAGVQDFGKVTFSGEYRGQATRTQAYRISGHLGVVSMDILQPVHGDNALNAFLKAHGDGIFSIVYRAESAAQMQSEAERLGALGVAVLQRMEVTNGPSALTYTFFDTEPRGKYVLGLVLSAEEAVSGTPAITHFAFAIREPKPVSDFWQQLGFPALRMAHASPREDSRYHGQPLLLPFEVGWQGFSKPTFEWIIPPQDPANCYNDFLNVHGEGVHHVGVPVADLDKSIAEYKEMGYGVLQSGAWGDLPKKGSGQYAYMDTDSIGGVSVELIRAYQ
ncbi:MAG: VOC family protein [Bryobacteraceae bacterium]